MDKVKAIIMNRNVISSVLSCNFFEHKKIFFSFLFNVIISLLTYHACWFLSKTIINNFKVTEQKFKHFKALKWQRKYSES